MSKLPVRVTEALNKVNTASVIFLHGSHMSAKYILDWIADHGIKYELPHVKFLYPTSQVMPYTAVGGKVTNIWFDRYKYGYNVPEHHESINKIKDYVVGLIDKEVKSGISLAKIVIGGFSMGGSLALHTGYRFVSGLGGVFALSTFLNKNSAVYSEFVSPKTPLYMCHGDQDRVVKLVHGERTFKELTKLGVKGQFIILNGAGHEFTKEELEGLLKWISKVTS